MDIRNLIREDLITLDLKARDKQAAIRELAGLLEKCGLITNEEEFLQDVLKRESITTTGIGYGIAIPHAKSKAVKKSAVVFGRSKHGIEWESLDGQPVDMVFLIATPAKQKENEHLKVLSLLSRKLIYEEFRQRLRESKTIQEILEILNTVVEGD